MTEVQYQEWILEGPFELKEGLESFCFDEGALAIAEEPCSESGFRIVACFPCALPFASKCQEFLQSLAEIFPTSAPVTFRTRQTQRTEWALEYRKYFKPQRLSRTFFLKPSWERTAPPPEFIPIAIEPGLAFGTGLHESTQLALLAAEEVLQKGHRRDFDSFLDVGTGSGILSIALRHLGIPQGVAIDLDADAVAAAQENFALNSIHNVELLQGSLEDIAALRKFPLIVSNILLETHRSLLPRYANHLAPQGKLILSGLLTDQREAVEEACQKQGFQAEIWRSRKEWMAVVLYQATL